MGAKVREFMTHWDSKGPIWYERDEDELVGTQRSGGRPMPRIRIFDLQTGTLLVHDKGYIQNGNIQIHGDTGDSELFAS